MHNLFLLYLYIIRVKSHVIKGEHILKWGVRGEYESSADIWYDMMVL